MRPKPMVEIGGTPDPVAHHEDLRRARHQRLRDLLRLQGLRDQGVLRELLPAHVATSRSTSRRTRSRALHRRAEPWRVTLVDTGESTMTGGRLKRSRLHRRRDVLLHLRRRRRRRRHRQARSSSTARTAALATVTAVQPPGRFGALDARRTATGRALRREAARRRRLGQRRLLRPRARGARLHRRRRRRSGSASRSSGSPRDGQARRRTGTTGFWQPMDTLRDKMRARGALGLGRAPWKVWSD